MVNVHAIAQRIFLRLCMINFFKIGAIYNLVIVLTTHKCINQLVKSNKRQWGVKLQSWSSLKELPGSLKWSAIISQLAVNSVKYFFFTGNPNPELQGTR